MGDADLSTPFNGVLDGHGYVIKNLEVDILKGKGTSQKTLGNRDGDYKYVGVFASLDPNAIIRNLKFDALGVFANNRCVGGLVGYNKGARLENIHLFSGSVVADFREDEGSAESDQVMICDGREGRVGGLVAYNDGGDIVRSGISSFAVRVNAFSGLPEENTAPEIKIGGLIGFNRGGQLDDVYVRNEGIANEDRDNLISGKEQGGSSPIKSYAGGLIGWNENSNLNSIRVSGVDVEASDVAGGLVGRNISSDIYNSSIKSSRVYGVARSPIRAGGLVGWSSE